MFTTLRPIRKHVSAAGLGRRDIVRAPGQCLHYGVISQGRRNANWVFISILTEYNMKCAKVIAK